MALIFAGVTGALRILRSKSCAVQLLDDLPIEFPASLWLATNQQTAKVRLAS
jgi:hypothetical protein